MLLCFRKSFVSYIHWQSAPPIHIRVFSFRALWQIRLCSVALPIPLWKYGYSFASTFLSASFARSAQHFLGVHLSLLGDHFYECVYCTLMYFGLFVVVHFHQQYFTHISLQRMCIFSIYITFFYRIIGLLVTFSTESEGKGTQKN